METLLIILAVVWIIVPILAKKKQQQSKEQAERELAARQRAAQAAALQQAEQERAARQARPTPLAPSVRPSQASFQQHREGSGSEGIGSHEGTAGPGAPARSNSPSRLQEATSSLTQIEASQQHTISASSDSGHAHEESSMRGLDASCPPETQPATQAAKSAVTGLPENAFLWNPADVRSGLVLAEILGPCLALRE